MADYLSEKDIDEFFKDSNSSSDFFICEYCKKKVSLDAPGTKNRNHCPFCLSSKHVDKKVGDRNSDCGGEMKAVGKFLRPNGEEVLIHKCMKCGKVANNRIAGDDDFDKVKNLPVLTES